MFGGSNVIGVNGEGLFGVVTASFRFVYCPSLPLTVLPVDLILKNKLNESGS